MPSTSPNNDRPRFQHAPQRQTAYTRTACGYGTVPFCSADSAKSAAADRRFSNENSRPGRKPVLDDVKRREICAILAIGGSRTLAACYVGCSLDTIARTALRDPAFADQIRKATVGCELLFLRNLQSAAQDSRRWRAVAWALERFYPDRYGRRPPRTITRAQLRQAMRQVGANIMYDISSAADRQRVLARLDKMARGANRQLTKPRRRLKRSLEK